MTIDALPSRTMFPTLNGLVAYGRRVWGHLARRPLRDLSIGVARRLGRPLPDRAYLTLGFFLYFGRWPNYTSPRTFNEHIHEYMLRCRDPLLRTVADKIGARDFIMQQGFASYLIPLLGVWNDADVVPLATLPRPCVLKPSAASGLVLMLRPGDNRDPAEMRAVMRNWLRRDYSRLHREWCYAGLPRRIVAETMLVDPSHEVPEDYKAYVIGGAVRFFQVDRGRFGEHTRNIYSPQWELLPARWSLETHPAEPRPACLEEMIAVAEALARSFEFLRVDFYYVDKRLYIGELTNYPGAGFEKFIPSAYADEMGAYWKRPGG